MAAPSVGPRVGPAAQESSALSPQAEAGPSHAAPPTPASRAGTLRATLPVQNVLTVFAAHFHVRRGNEIVWAEGMHSQEELSKAGIEWKVLPSGSHLVERDVLYFSVSVDTTEQEREQQHGHLFGVATFRNKKLGAQERAGVVAGEQEDDQRGARMTAIGAIVDCGPTLTPWTQLAATVPHIERLSKLSDAYASDPTCLDLFREWLETHKRTETFRPDQDRTLGGGSMPSPVYAHDPLYMLPAVSNSLGPLLPHLLKQLLVDPQRVLIYIPPGVSTVQAACIAFNLGELAQAGCQAGAGQMEEDARRGGEPGSCPMNSMRRHGLVIRGIVGLHDVTGLQDNDKSGSERTSWIAWTADRILMEKPELYDVLVDLTPVATAQLSSSSGLRNEGYETSTALPRLMSVHQEVKDGRKKVMLQRQTWTTREFAVFRGLEEKASVQSTSPRHVRRALSRSFQHRRGPLRRSVTEPALASTQNAGILTPSTRSLAATRSLSLFALIRFWLSSLWIIPPRWRANLRSGYGYVPLSIRSDGGVRASIMLLPDGDSDSSDAGSSESDEEVPSSRIAANSRRSSRQLSNADASLHADYFDDPILAAAGAGSVATSNRRRRKSRTTASRTASAYAESTAGTLLNGSESEAVLGAAMPFDPSATLRPGDVSLEDTKTREQRLEDLHEAQESLSLALCLFSSWSEWVAETVSAVLDVVEVKAESSGVHVYGAEATNEVDIGNGEAHPTTASSVKRRRCALTASSIVPSGHESGTESGAEKDMLYLSSSDLRDMGLSSTNAVDIDLVQYLASSVTGADVVVRKSWPLLRVFGY